MRAMGNDLVTSCAREHSDVLTLSLGRYFNPAVCMQ